VGNRIVRLISKIIACTAIAASSISAQGATVGEQQSFAAISQMTVSDINQGNLDAFIGICSHDGLLVVNREVDWKRSASNDGNKRIGTGHKRWISNLSLSRSELLVWQEVESRFYFSELHGIAFKSAFQQFHNLVRNSEDGYPKYIFRSVNMQDAWKSRYLGPAIQGKIASNTFWYVYLRQEANEWKIWKLEFVRH